MGAALLSVLPLAGPAWGSFVPMNSGTSSSLLDVWGSAPDDVWAVGQGGTILHYDGLGWSAVQPGLTGVNLFTISGSSASNIFAHGTVTVDFVTERTTLHYNGSQWSVLDPPEMNVFDLWVAPDDGRVFFGGTTIPFGGPALGSGGGRMWTAPTSPQTSPESFFNTFWGTGSDNVLVHNRDGRIYHYDGNSDSVPGRIGRWDFVDRVGGGNGEMLFGFENEGAPDDVFLVVDGVFGSNIQHHTWDGTTLSTFVEPTIGVPGNAREMWGTAADDWYVVNTQGSVYHYDGTGLSLVGSTDAGSLLGVIGFESGEVFAVGGNGTILGGGLSELFIWRGAEALDVNWHTLSGSETNWKDRADMVHVGPPGDGGDEVVRIEGANVVLDQRPASIRSLQATGSLEVRQPLTAAQDSSIQSLMLGSSITTHGALEVSGLSQVTTDATIAGGGRLRLTGGEFSVDLGRTLTVNSALSIEGGEVGGPGLIVASNTVHWTGGTLTGLPGGVALSSPASAAALAAPAAAAAAGDPVPTDFQQVMDVTQNLTIGPGGTSVLQDGRLTTQANVSQQGNLLLVRGAVENKGTWVIESGQININGESDSRFFNRGTLKKTGEGFSEIGVVVDSVGHPIVVGNPIFFRSNLRLFRGSRLGGAPITLDGGDLELAGGTGVEHRVVEDLIVDGFARRVLSIGGTFLVEAGRKADLTIPRVEVVGARFGGIDGGLIEVSNGEWFLGESIGGSLTEPGGLVVVPHPALSVNTYSFDIRDRATIAGRIENRSMKLNFAVESEVRFSGGALINRTEGVIMAGSSTIGSVPGASRVGDILNEGKIVFRRTEGGGSVVSDVKLDNRGEIEVRESLDYNGPVAQIDAPVLTGGTWVVKGPDARLRLAGQTDNQAPTISRNQGKIVLADGGTFVNLRSGTPGRFTNEGVFEIEGNLDTGTRTIFEIGEFVIPEGGQLILKPLGVLKATWVIAAQRSSIKQQFGSGLEGRVEMGGRHSLGRSPGTGIVTGDYLLTETGVLEIELGGLLPDEEHDQLIVNGMADLQGLIEVTLVGLEVDGVEGEPFVPELEDFFDIVLADAIEPRGRQELLGLFSLPLLDGGRFFDVSVAAAGDGKQALRLTVVPEPGAAAWLAASLFAAIRWRGRRASA